MDKKLRIGLFGCYNNTSIGDHAILEGILNQFNTYLGDVSVIVFSMDPEATRNMLFSQEGVTVSSATPCLLRKRSSSIDYHTERYNSVTWKNRVKSALANWPGVYKLAIRLRMHFAEFGRDVRFITQFSFWREKCKEILSIDLLVIGGGNLLMDVWSIGPLLILMYTVLGRIKRKPVMFYAVGAGPIRTKRGACYMNISARLASMLTFRDRQSLDLVQKKFGISPGKMVLSADPALCLDPCRKEIRRGNNERLVVGMTVVPYHRPPYWPGAHDGLYNIYKGQIAKFIHHILEDFNVDIVLFATNYPKDIVVANEIIAHIKNKNRLRLVTDKLNVMELIGIISECDAVIGTRLHSLILSMVAGRPFLAMSYQPKVMGFCQSVGFERNAVEMSEHLVDLERRLYKKFQEFIPRIEEEAARLNDELIRSRDEAAKSCLVAKKLLAKSSQNTWEAT